jgi:hypothetical protein
MSSVVSVWVSIGVPDCDAFSFFLGFTTMTGSEDSAGQVISVGIEIDLVASFEETAAE